QMWQLGTSGSGAGSCSAEISALTVFERISSSRFICAPLLGPALQDTVDVAPATGVDFSGLAEGVLYPVCRIPLRGLHQPVADHGRDGPDLLLIEAEDGWPRVHLGCYRYGAGA